MDGIIHEWHVSSSKYWEVKTDGDFRGYGQRHWVHGSGRHIRLDFCALLTLHLSFQGDDDNAKGCNDDHDGNES